MKKTMILAIGGNAINKSDQEGTLAQQIENVNEMVGSVVDLIEEGYQVILTHGNGPQVGILMVKNEMSRECVPNYPLELCNAQTSGSIGYIIQQNLENELKERNVSRKVITVLTETLVHKEDPAFQNPDKPIGSFYPEEEAKRLEKEKGYVMKEDSGRGYRRVVPSPKPVDILQKDAIQTLSDDGYIVICTGGGGVPVVQEGSRVRGVDAVIDKDRASALLAKEINADHLMLLTGVEQVAIAFGKPEMRWLQDMSVEEAEGYLAQGEFPPGSMGPKIEAACEFVKHGPKGAVAIITSLDKMKEAMRHETGTWIRKEKVDEL